MIFEKLKSVDEFNDFVKNIQEKKGYKNPLGFGIARVDRGQLDKTKILQANFPLINWQENFGSSAVFVAVLEKLGSHVDFSRSEFVCDIDKNFVQNALNLFAPFLDEAKGENHKNIQVLKHLQEKEDLSNFRLIFLFEDDEPQSVEAIYLKLYALSLGKAPLRSLNLNGAFGRLENVAWSYGKPIELEWLRKNEIELKLSGNYPLIEAVDKFPRFLQHIIPQDNTRILDTSKVRMGARLSAGTTVMPGASYINFNAGTTGSVMVEGRISSSAIVGDGSDVGGGASILGVLSGTNGNPVGIGKNTLLGANSVTGIPLGDGCIVDAGVAILEGTKLSIAKSQALLLNEVNSDLKLDVSEDISCLKAVKLSNINGAHFRQNSKTGTIEVYRSKREIKLNKDLHV